MSSASPQANTEVQLKRCAVCKIDLKGSFVYIDEEIENLLGYTKEELFGKSISEFLNEDSQALIETVLAYRNHYESFFDATDLTVVDREQRQILTSAVISLNFIAGNPVNYQIIINPCSDDQIRTSTVAGGARLVERVRELINVDTGQNMNSLARSLRRISGAEAVFVYLISDSELVPRAGDFSDRPEFSFEAIPEPNELYRMVATTGQTYNFQNEAAVRLAVELIGEAPSEIICRRSLESGASYLICARYRPEGSCPVAIDAGERLEIGLLLFERLGSGQSGEEPEQSYDARFTVGFLDSLAIGAVLIAHEGTIAGYNPSFTTIMGLESLQGDLSTLIDLLAASDPDAPLGKIVDYLEVELSAENDQDLTLDLTAPSGTRCRLTVVRFSSEAGDKSSCLVLAPKDPVFTARNDSPRVTESLVARITGTMSEAIEELYQVSQRIAHENYDSLSETGKGLLRRLDTLSLGVKTTLVEIEKSEHLALANDAPQVIDVNLTLDRAIDSIHQRFPGQAFTCRFEALPSLKGNPELLGRIFDSVFEQLIRLNEADKTDARVKSESDDSSCRIYIDHDIKLLHEFLELPAKMGKKGLVTAGEKFSLETISAVLAVRYLIERSGGSLESRSHKGGQFTLLITLPIV